MKRNEILKNLRNKIIKEMTDYVENVELNPNYAKPHVLNLGYMQYKLRYLKALQNNMTLSEYMQTEYKVSETESLDYVNSLPGDITRDDKREFEYFKKYVDKLLKDADWFSTTYDSNKQSNDCLLLFYYLLRAHSHTTHDYLNLLALIESYKEFSLLHRMFSKYSGLLFCEKKRIILSEQGTSAKSSQEYLYKSS